MPEAPNSMITNHLQADHQDGGHHEGEEVKDFSLATSRHLAWRNQTSGNALTCLALL